MNIIIRLVITAFIGMLRFFRHQKKQQQQQQETTLDSSSNTSKKTLFRRFKINIGRKKSLPPPIPTSFTEESLVANTESPVANASTPPPIIELNSSANTPPPKIEGEDSEEKTAITSSKKSLKALFKKQLQAPQLAALLASLKKNINWRSQKRFFKEGYGYVLEQFLSLKKPSPSRDKIILRPSQEAETWELWKMTSAEPMLVDDHTAPVTPSSKTRLIVSVPTRDLTIIPLWIAEEGDLQQLVELELSSRHLLRRGMEEGLKTIPLETKEGRRLVVVLAPAATLSATTAPYLKQADQFEAAARLLPHKEKDLLIWQELGEICFGFFKRGECLWFSESGETLVNRQLIGLITRMSWQLQAESVIDHLPKSVGLIGAFSAEENELLQKHLQIEVHHDHLDGPQPPELPTPELDLPPQQAREERIEQEKKQRIKKVTVIAFAVYLFFVAIGFLDILVKESILKRLDYQEFSQKDAIEKANRDIERWQEFRSAIDPNSYALDLLTTVASQIHGEKIRLITFAKADSHLQISGEATDVSQAYHFIELIKKNPDLQEYQWSSGQPKLAGKNSVRFELEGSQAQAKKNIE